ncbi:hypothetical protein V5J35_001767 [Endozoicomonas sp. NE40]|uniref:Uncharacterized protein n=1 Tax=Endozoicomonas lisbonensis TaxID=3120522 RepID=A0ABV2SFQ3_9GAMM
MSKPFESNRQYPEGHKGGVRSHRLYALQGNSYGDDPQRRILDSNGCAIGDFESAIGIIISPKSDGNEAIPDAASSE